MCDNIKLHELVRHKIELYERLKFDKMKNIIKIIEVQNAGHVKLYKSQPELYMKEIRKFLFEIKF